jgi:hypothetical protein
VDTQQESIFTCELTCEYSHVENVVLFACTEEGVGQTGGAENDWTLFSRWTLLKAKSYICGCTVYFNLILVGRRPGVTCMYVKVVLLVVVTYVSCAQVCSHGNIILFIIFILLVIFMPL